jgi:hypothetical protein
MYLVLAKPHEMFNITSVSSKTKILQSKYTSITQYICSERSVDYLQMWIYTTIRKG